MCPQIQHIFQQLVAHRRPNSRLQKLVCCQTNIKKKTHGVLGLSLLLHIWKLGLNNSKKISVILESGKKKIPHNCLVKKPLS